jgi:hypothetical protein
MCSIFKKPAKAKILEPVQSAANCATALRAIRIAPENAGLDSSRQITRIVRGHSGKCALLRTGWRHTDRPAPALETLTFLIASRSANSKSLSDSPALFIGRLLAEAVISHLASVVRPDASSLRASAASPPCSDSPLDDCLAPVGWAQDGSVRADYSAASEDD